MFECKLNDIITFNDKTYRIIYVTEKAVVLFEMNTTKLNGFFLPIDKVFTMLQNGSAAIKHDEDNDIVDDEIADEGYWKRKSIVMDARASYGPTYMKLVGKKNKPEMIAIIDKYQINPSTFRRIILKYIQSGCKLSSLLADTSRTFAHPEIRRGRKPKDSPENHIIISDIHKENFEKALKSLQQNPYMSYRKAYDEMNNSHYSCINKGDDGNLFLDLLPQNKRPTFKQFYYFCQKHTTLFQRKQAKEGEKEIRLNERILLGDTLSNSFGPGDLIEIDAVEAKVSLRSILDPEKSVGNPVVYVMIDVYSKVIIAAGIGYENNSFVALSTAYMNLAEDKADLLEKYGLNRELAKYWPSGIIPRCIRCDRGSDFVSHDHERICKNFGIQLDILPGGMGSLKGNIESLFHTFNSDTQSHLYKYGLISKKYGSKHHKEAVMTFNEFSTLFYSFIIFHNQQHMDQYTPDMEMLANNVVRTPIDIWKYGLNLYTPRPIRDPVSFYQSLLKPDNANLSRSGIEYKGLFYINEKDNDLLERMFACGNKVEKVHIYYDPRDVSTIYYLVNYRLIPAPLNPNYDNQMTYKNLTFDQWDECHKAILKQNRQMVQQKDCINATKYEIYEEIVQKANQKAPRTIPDKKNMKANRSRDKQAINHENSLITKINLIQTEKLIPPENSIESPAPCPACALDEQPSLPISKPITTVSDVNGSQVFDSISDTKSISCQDYSQENGLHSTEKKEETLSGMLSFSDEEDLLDEYR